jgi:hypothetical protein
VSQGCIKVKSPITANEEILGLEFIRGVRSTNGLGIKKVVSKASGGGSRKH